MRRLFFTIYRLWEGSSHSNILRSVVITFLFAAILPRIPIIKDSGTKIMSVIFCAMGIFALFVNVQFGTVVYGSPPLAVMVIATVLLIVLCGLAMLAMRSILMFFVCRESIQAEVWPWFGNFCNYKIVLF